MPPRAAVRVRLHGWRHPTILTVAAMAVASGFAQFAPTASLADVAAAFGADGGGAAQVGLSATTVGVGLAVIRFASLGALPLSSVADQLGRRRVLLWCLGVGLALTAIAAGSPSFWWFVAVVALSRPLFSTTNAVGAVIAGEETTSADRSKAVALAVAGYGIGAGIVSVARVPLDDLLGVGFRALFLLALVPLLLLPVFARLLDEPDRFVALRAERQGPRLRPDRALRALTSVHPSLRPRLLLLTAVTFMINLVTGPVNTFLFFYAEGQLGISPAGMAGAVIAAGPIALGGLLIGRWVADRFGRRPGAIVFHVLLACAAVATYSGAPAALVIGYWLGVASQGAYGPVFGTLSTEVFPTSHRATAQGWLAAAGVLGATTGLALFGAMSDAVGSFVVAALVVAVPCALAAGGYLLLPETRGLELEESAPEIGADAPGPPVDPTR